MKEKIVSFIRKTEQTTVVRAIRSGLVNMIPVLIIGAFALIIKSFPIKAYETFIKEFAGGFIYGLFNFIFSATFGILSVYMTFSISRSYMKIKADPDAVTAGAVITALASFFILAGFFLKDVNDFNIEYLGVKSMFLAIITGLGASALYLWFFRLFKKRKHYIFSAGADREFNRMLSTFFPILIVVCIFALFNQLVIAISGMDSFRSLLIAAFDKLFGIIPAGFFKGFFFVFLSSLMWFFGIHGSDTLEEVMQSQFGAVAKGTAFEVNGVVLSKEFFDCFVLMGGCGATICLLIAILIFSRNRAHRGLGYTAAFPMAFNINELMVFGLPIILNPIMLIPFLLVPLVCYTVAYIAVATGLVPVISSGVEWTTPIILGGYKATGSVAGALLQVFNVTIGVLIYLPFVKLLDKHSEESLKRNYQSFMDYYKNNESGLQTVNVTAISNAYGDFAKSLCADIKYGLKEKVRLAYQPQYDHDGNCIGVEALLRYDHYLHGVIYPPLVIKLAQEGGFLSKLEKAVLVSALDDKKKIAERFGKDVKLSVNVTGTTVVTEDFLQFVKRLKDEGALDGANLCIEITEQAALSFDDRSITVLRSLRKMGVLLSIDDFSMGKTSINYLKNNLFDEIKLDGSLVKGLSTHDNCRDIIRSITGLATTLDLTVLAEYVETEEERDTLHEIGCDRYQGYLYSPAVYLDE